MLNQHPSVYIGPPIPLFECFAPIIHTYGDLDDDSVWAEVIDDAIDLVSNNHQPIPVEIDAAQLRSSLVHMTRGWASLVQGVYQYLADRMNATTMGYKYSTNMSNLSKFLDAMDFTHVIYQVRDPRDVVISTIEAGFNTKKPVEIAADWQSAQNYIEAVLANSPLKVHRLQYENLLQAPGETLATIWQFLDVPDPGNVDQFYLDPANRDASEKSHMWANLGKPLIRENTARYYRQWNYLAVRRIEREVKTGLARFHYRPARFWRFKSFFNRPRRRTLTDSDRLFVQDQQEVWGRITRKAETRTTV